MPAERADEVIEDDIAPPVSTAASSLPPGPRLPTGSRLARLGRRLIRVRRYPRGGRRLRRPDGRSHYASLAVADLDLSTGSARLVPALHDYESPPEGVHALVWFHGEPIGELTVPGDPDALMARLPALAERELKVAVLEHLLRDALATAGGIARSVEEGLHPVAHPEASLLDGSDVTIAVCTRDRPEDLRRCLDAIDRLTSRVYEVVVVDNAPTDDRTRTVADQAGVRYVREPRAGLDWARNRALLEARTRIVAFTDDDVLVHPSWVRGLLRAFAEEPEAVAVTGLVAPAELVSSAQVLFEAQGGFGRGYRRKWLSVAIDAGETAAQLYPGTGGAGTGANMALLRDRALALGGFDPALDVGTATGGGGDLEMFFRVLASGGLLVYEPGAVVRHVHRTTIPQFLRQMRGHGTGSYAIFTGAGLRYGSVQAREFLLFSIWWMRHHLRVHLLGLLWPRMWPWAMARAETRGALASVIGRYYARARTQAAKQAALHPSEPRTPPLVHPRASGRIARQADPVISIDLTRDDLAVGADPAPPAEVSRCARRLRVRVLRDGKHQDVLTIWTGGSRASAARLRAETVAKLGPAILTPGGSWADLSSDALDGAPTAIRAPAERHERRPEVPNLTVSVLIATRDRPGPLRRSVASLLRDSSSRRLQVVVVDNSPDPTDTTEALAGLPGVEILHEPRPGLSRARNAALPVLTGDVVVFIDDDGVITPGWLDALLEPFADPEVAAVTGNVLPADLEALEAQVFEDYGGLGRGPHRKSYRPSWLRASWGPATTWHIGATANTAIRRRVLERLGPFDEALGAGRPAGVGEDTEYFYRLLKAGGTIRYEPTAVVLHYHRADRPALRRQLQAYTAGHVAYHLQVLSRYGDLRGLGRIAVGLPRHYLRRGWWVWRGRDDYPRDVLAAEIRGALLGIPAWVQSRWSTR